MKKDLTGYTLKAIHRDMDSYKAIEAKLSKVAGAKVENLVIYSDGMVSVTGTEKSIRKMETWMAQHGVIAGIVDWSADPDFADAPFELEVTSAQLDTLLENLKAKL